MWSLWSVNLTVTHSGESTVNIVLAHTFTGYILLHHTPIYFGAQASEIVRGLSLFDLWVMTGAVQHNEHYTSMRQIYLNFPDIWKATT